MTVEFERSDLDRQGGMLTARPHHEVELRTHFVGVVHSPIERCSVAEDTRRCPRPTHGFPGVNGIGHVH